MKAYVEITKEFSKMFTINSNEVAKAETWSVNELNYGVKVVNGKRTDSTDKTADKISCPSCNKDAFKRVKTWEKVKPEVFVCEHCNKIFREKV